MPENENKYYDLIIRALDDYNAGKLSFKEVSRIPMKDVEAAKAYALQKAINHYISIQR